MLALRRDGRLVGLAPWFVHLRPEDGLRQLTFLGNGVSDRLDVLLAPEARAEAAQAIWAWLAQGPDVWDVCDLRDLPADSALLAAQPPPGLRVETEPEVPCPVLPLPPSAEALRLSLPRKARGNLATAHRRAEALGEVRIETADRQSVGRFLDVLLELHRARWQGRGGEGALAGAERFHRLVATGFQQRGWLRLHLMTIGGRPAAAHYGFQVKGRAYFYIGGFDPEFAHASPGALLLWRAIEAAIREGASAFDFLRGQEAYKYLWGAVDQPQVRLRISRA